MCSSFKNEILQGGHCLSATIGPLTATNSTSTAVTGLTSTAGIAVGMAVTGANVAANTFVSNITSATALTLSVATTGSATSLTFTGDVFKLALVKVTPSTTFGASTTNIGTPGTSASSQSNLGTDEIAASGSYASGGVTLVNVSPVLSGSTACATWSNVSITSATISTTAAIIYNSTTRLGAAAAPLAGRTVEVLDFGGTQTVTSGTITLTFPSQAAGTAVLQIA